MKRTEPNPYENSRDGYIGNIKNSSSPININVTTEPTYDDVRKQQNFMNYPERPKYTVRFFDGDKEYIELKQLVKEGDLAKKPSTPIKEGFIFERWFIKTRLSRPYDFSSPVYTDVLLKAQWREAETYTISFKNSVTNDTQSGIDSQIVLEENAAINPGSLENQEYESNTYIFKHWSATKDGATPFDFSTIITEDTVLWSVWVEKTGYTVCLKSGEGSGNNYYLINIASGNINFEEDDEYTLPTSDTCGFIAPEGMVFDCWKCTAGAGANYGEGDSVDPGENDTIVADDMEWIAQWSPSSAAESGIRSLMKSGLVQSEETEINLYTANIDSYIGNKFNSPNIINVNNYDENEIISVEVINRSQGTQKLKNSGNITAAESGLQ